MRTYLMTAALAGLFLAGPAPAAEIDKYLPEGATTYVHIRTKNLLTSEVVRKTIPVLFDKYGDQLAGLMKLAKQFNPQTPDIPEEQLKEVLGQLKKPETIANGFDAAKDYAPEIIVTGDPEKEPDSFLILVKCDESVTSDLVEGFVPLVNQTGQMKIKKAGKGKAAVFEITMVQQDQTIFAGFPEAGIIAIGMKRAAVEGAAKAQGDKINAELKKLIAKRDSKDFIFAAGVKGKGDEQESYVGNLVLDKDISGKVSGTFGTDAKAKAFAEEMNENLSNMLEGLKTLTGDNKELKSQLEKFKAKADGKSVTLDGKLSGATIEKLLKD